MSALVSNVSVVVWMICVCPVRSRRRGQTRKRETSPKAFRDIRYKFVNRSCLTEHNSPPLFSPPPSHGRAKTVISGQEVKRSTQTITALGWTRRKESSFEVPKFGLVNKHSAQKKPQDLLDEFSGAFRIWGCFIQRRCSQYSRF